MSGDWMAPTMVYLAGWQEYSWVYDSSLSWKQISCPSATIGPEWMKFSYACNAATWNVHFSQGLGMGMAFEIDGGYGVKVSKVVAPVSAIFFADVHQKPAGGSPYLDGPYNIANAAAAKAWAEDGDFAADCMIGYRHNKAGNVLYVDGHVEPLNAANIAKDTKFRRMWCWNNFAWTAYCE